MLIPLALLVFAEAAPPNAASLEDRAAAVVAQKARMPNRYSLTMRVECRVPNAPPPLESEWSGSFSIWRDGTKFRNDSFDANHLPSRPNHVPGERHVGCENCERDGYGIVTTILPGSPSVRHMVEFKRLGTWSFERYCLNFDWRFFGLRNDRQCGYPRSQIASDFQALFRQKDLEARADKHKSLQCVVAHIRIPVNNYERSVWLSEPHAFNPVLFEETFEVMGKPETRTTEIEWQKTASGHFYPKRVKTNSIIGLNGAKYASEEVVTITHLDLDTPIDPSVFTVAGFGLNEGQVIGYPELEDKGLPRWKNGRVEYPGEEKQPAGGAAAPMATAPYPVESNLTLVVGVVAAVVAVGTAAAALVLRRRRSAT